MAAATPPVALTIAGSDPSGGAGIQADLKTFSALGVYGATVITVLTAQNTRGVSGVFAIPADFIRAEFRAVISDLPVSAIKTGMLSDRATVEAVAELLGEVPDIPVVVDPVMVATSGDTLLSSDAIDAVRQRLVPRANLITPNLPEAAKLLDEPPAASPDEMLAQAGKLLQLGCAAVLLKGGHGPGPEALDILFDGKEQHILKRPRIDTRNTHGTGCTLSAAITSHMARGDTLLRSVEAAKRFVWDALVSGAALAIGSGNGPVDHLFALRKRST